MSLLIISACGVPIKLAQPDRDNSITVPIETIAHLSIVEIFINDSGPYKFILDTGASITVLNATLADKLSLPVVGTMEIGSPMGTVPIIADSLSVQYLRLGSVIVKNPPAISMPLDDMLGSLGQIDGVLSADAFGGYMLTMDFPKNEVRLKMGALPESGPRIINYDGSEGIPIIPMTVGNESVNVALDSGMPSTLILQSDYASRLPLMSAPTTIGQGRVVDATFDIVASELNGSIEFGDISISHPQITFTERTSKATMGMAVLGNYALTIDRTNHRLMFEPSDGVTPQRSGPRRMVRRGGSSRGGYGIQLAGIDGDVLGVRGVEPGRPAEKGGLKGGDQIVALNGEPVASLSRAERMTHLRGSKLVLTIQRDSATLDLHLSLE